MAVRRDGTSTFGRQVSAFAVVLVFASTFGLGITALVDGPSAVADMVRTTAYQLHDPITIEYDDEFIAENGVVSGSGTEGDPYLISGWEFDMDGLPYPTCAVAILNTTASFVITDVFIHGDDTSYAWGVCLTNVTSCSVEACRIDGVNTGLCVRSSSQVNVTDNELIDTECTISGSNQVGFANNEGYGVAVRISSSTNATVAHNEVNYALSDEEPRGMSVDVWTSDRCTILGNILWSAMETGARSGIIGLDRSTNCTVDDNAMDERGLQIETIGKTHITTHDIGPNNTVRMLPLKAYVNAEDVLVDRAGFGQLLIANCTDVRLRDLSLYDLGCPISLLFSSDVEVSDCVFTDTYQALSLRNCTDVRLRDLSLYDLGCPISLLFSSDVEVSDCVFTDTYQALSLRNCTDVRIRHNTFINGSEVWATKCDRLDFSDNRFASGTYGTLYASGLTNSTIEDNQFAQEAFHEVYIAGSENLTIRNNQLSRGGLRIEGHTASEYDSHTIDQSNLGVGGKPILFLKSQTGLKVDLGNYSQLLMGNCSEIDAYGMTTSAGWAIQIGFSTRVSVHGCGIYGFHPINLRYADGITFFENDFVNPTWLMHLMMTHNVTTYHCNILGSYGCWVARGFDNYTPTNIRWDNGYPDGGNYWEGWRAYDDYSGPAQDEPGSDGICDRPKEMPWGYDRYPLATPYVRGLAVEPDTVWQDPVLWLSAMAGIVIASIAISYVLFVREGPRRPEPVPPENREGP